MQSYPFDSIGWLGVQQDESKKVVIIIKKETIGLRLDRLAKKDVFLDFLGTN